MFGLYVLNKAMSNTDGLGTFPANSYKFAGEYGPASTDVRHRATVGGSMNTRWNVRFSPFVTMQSGPPFDITAGPRLFRPPPFQWSPPVSTQPPPPRPNPAPP